MWSGLGDEATVERVLAEYEDGSHSIVLEVRNPDGTIGNLDLGADGRPVVRVVGTEASRGRAGCVVDQLDLDRFTAGVIVVEDAQWADATSLGRLRRFLSGDESHLLIVLARRPQVESWTLDQLIEEARRRGILFELEAEASARPLTGLSGTARDLVLAASLLAEPLAVGVAARLLGVTESEVMDAADSLVDGGLLSEARAGYSVTGPVAGGDARLGRLAGRLAEILDETGADPAVVGSLWSAAGDGALAYPRLRSAALGARESKALGEAFHLARLALESAESSGSGEPAELGELHLVCGQYLRAAGRSKQAAEHLEQAVRALRGPARIDALGFQAAVADDLQHPQEAERILAIAAWEAARQSDLAKLGSIGTFRARAMNRLGFADESDVMLARSIELLASHGGERQRMNAETNRAWISFDRGDMVRSELEFSRVLSLIDAHDTVALADTRAWLGRVLFATGQPDTALEQLASARRLAGEVGIEAPMFIAELGYAEGGLYYGLYDDALAAVERARDLVEAQLTAWSNVVAAHAALALLRLGRLDEARAQVDAALAATPAGADGWRWRSRCQAISLEIDAASGGRVQREAEDLADMLLQSGYHGWAAELFTVVAEHGRRTDTALEAMALAIHAGNPMLAIRAVAAGKLWNEPAARGTIRAIQRLEARVPEGWIDKWRQVPGVAEALAAPEPVVDEGESTAIVQAALTEAGLGGDRVLSPAQRRRAGLVRHRNRRRPLRLAAAAAAVVVLAGATSLAVAQLQPSEPGVTVVREVVTQTTGVRTTQPLPLEETQIQRAETAEAILGLAPLRGGPSRAGVTEAAGPRSVDGFYWIYETADPIEATPVAYGRNLLVPSTDGTLYALDQTSGSVVWSLRTGGRLTTSPDVVTVEMGEGQRPAMAIIAGEDGVVRARDALSDLASEAWSTELGSRVASSPVVADGMVFVATVDGVVHGLDPGGGEEIWRFPADDATVEDISAALTYSDGVVYAAAEDGRVYLLEGSTGELRCEMELGAGMVASPIVAGGAVYLPTRGNTIFVRPEGECGQTPVTDRLPLYGTETPVEVAPAISGDTMYLPSGRFLYAIDLRDNSFIWEASTVDAGSAITAAPVVTGDTVYVGTEAGVALAVDSTTGEELWRWQTGNYVRASVVVVDGAAFVASGDGRVYAVGEG